MPRLDIERLAYGGDAIAHLDDGRTAFVSGGVPGDSVSAEIVEDKGRFVRARVTEVLEPSAHRVAPPCPYFGACGGCTWQHIDYAEQLRAKRQELVDALQRVGKIAEAERLVDECVASDRQYGYRNKIELVLDPDHRRPRLGYHRAGSHEVVAVDSCLLLPKRHAHAPKSLGGALRYVAGESDLGIERVAMRCAAHTRDVEVALWTSPGPFPRAATAKTLGQAMQMSSLVRVMTRDNDRAKLAGVEVLAGKGHWREKLDGRSYAVSAPSFFQVNSTVAERMVQLVNEMLAPDGSDRVLDLYAGAGTFTLPLAELAGEVVAVEAAGSAVKDLRRNLEQNAVWADVVGGDAAREISSLGRFDLALVDPPRVGLHTAVIKQLTRTRPRALVYVSCDPATLARDTARLAEAGLALTRAVPFDLFPQTFHVETIALFQPAPQG